MDIDVGSYLIKKEEHKQTHNESTHEYNTIINDTLKITPPQKKNVHKINNTLYRRLK